MAKIAVREPMAPGETLVEKFKNLRELGYDGIELTQPYTMQHVPEIKRAMKESGGIQPSITSCGGACLVDARRPERERGVQMLIQLLEVSAEIGAVGVLHPPLISMKMQIGGPRVRVPDLSPVMSMNEVERKLLIAEYQRVCKRAEQLGTYLVIEPLNRYEQWWPCTLKEAVEICEEVGSPNCRIMADFFHMNIEEVDIAKSIEETAGYIMNVHIADSTRQSPPNGHTDFVPGFKALKKAGYEGFLGLECALPGDRLKELRRAGKYVRDLYDNA